MDLYLDLTVGFLTDRYHGCDWPPSPARLFQALVAGAKTGAAITRWEDRHQRALEWLERLTSPDIYARSTIEGQGYTLFVPNNSLDGEQKSTKTSKLVRPHILTGRVPGQPDILYRWRFEDEPGNRDHLVAVDEIASRLRALGWGIDFAAACVELAEHNSVPPSLDHFAPDISGDISLLTPQPGFLAHLGDCHERFTHRITSKGIDPYTRPVRFGQARYRNTSTLAGRRSIPFELDQPEGDRFSVRWDQAQIVSAMVRHAAKEAMLQEEMETAWIDSYICGHNQEGDLGRRLSYVPLPSIGHHHSDGGVRRVLIVEPPSPTPEDREALDLLAIKLTGWTLIDQGGTPRAVLTPPKDKKVVLPFYVRPTYMKPATSWESVTPVCLHGFNASRGEISLTKTDRLLCQAFEAAGFPASGIAEMTFQNAPHWAGCGSAGRIRVPQHLSKWPRVHVRVTFKKPVEGPVLAGIGRHYGIGVFAARSDEGEEG